MDEIIRLFPPKLKSRIVSDIGSDWSSLQEIRIRVGRTIELIFDNHTKWVNNLLPSMEDGVFLINQLSQFSLYRIEDELREGFITIEGGHRVGLTGKVNTSHGAVKAIKHISSFNIRIAKEKIGVASNYISYLYEKHLLNTLIIGPPQTGKTTLLRDFARLISNGWKNNSPLKVGIVDERSEIGGSIKGIPQHDLGKRTDIMDACPKAEGLMMMIRSMSPDVIIVDEIGSEKDVLALLEAMHAGVRIICSVHGDSLSDIKKRPSLQLLLKQQAFDRFICLERTNTPGKVSTILMNDGKNILRKPRCTQDEMDRGTSPVMQHYLGRI
ncbi:stage III sporulation protein AA [Aquibacillus rhizosphaerae]|uniref:Stage III sporulation protein AA n=1 Tax=Aquibacillus rhizosphaerae TaxID=3051431 RepID=A0ABT7LAK6_9BACI|nr:stage III sporulation protein AA [Aquibacillus sp. LR5S19]MDL4841581.1 stage III sporulation protein AA [Aquibacillus sp. LR5S19]